MRILIAEDELSLARVLTKILQRNNCSADAVHNGHDALSYIESGNYDALILDLMLPGMDGIAVLKTLRARGERIPVLILTAKAELDDRVLGLDSGADYYLTKPFESKELMAALRAITRSPGELDSRLRLGNISLDRASHELSSPTGSMRLANKEFQMLEMLMANPRHIISAERFMERIWGYGSETELNVVWVYISYLRKKLKVLQADIQIKASRNAGYSLEESDAENT